MSKLLEPHLQILRRAASSRLPEVCNWENCNADVVRELIDAGYLSADPTSFGFRHRDFMQSYSDCVITLKGREYLQKLEDDAEERRLGRRALRLFLRLQTWIFVGLGALLLKAGELLLESWLKK